MPDFVNSCVDTLFAGSTHVLVGGKCGSGNMLISNHIPQNHLNKRNFGSGGDFSAESSLM